MAASFQRLFVANRGEVAVRIARACDSMGITPVFGVSEADAEAPYTRNRETVLLGPARSAQSYLDVERVVQAAAQARCTALHPGWGFLSENPLLATLCAQHGVTFIGPPPHVTALMGSKTKAKRAMKAAGMHVIAGSDGPLRDVEEAKALGAHIGFPLLFKAENGGGGRGMRIARRAEEIESAFADAQQEARAAFGGDRVYVERLIEGGRHVEVQIMADRYGHALALGERDCTVQRNHQKLIEESPATAISEEIRSSTCAAAARAAAAVGYVGAGTMELLYDPEHNVLRFMEMNCRLQVEHTVTEERTGLDLVRMQIEVAAGKPLPLAQHEVQQRGHTIECRINAEDPTRNFAPAPGRITKWQLPSLPGVPATAIRVDTHVEAGYVVPPHYDSLICKVLASGADRAEAIDRMIAALQSLQCEGIPTTIDMQIAILRSPEFRENRYDTRAIPGWK